MTSTDQIRKQIVIHAPQAKVWDALSNAEKFGTWFGARFDGPFESGRRLKMVIEPTQVAPEIAKEYEKYRGVEFDVWIDAIEPQDRFVFLWQSYAIDEGVDPEDAAKTTVEFLLSPSEEGTQLTVTESGFDQIPLDRRAQAFAGNEQGWNTQIELLKKFAER